MRTPVLLALAAIAVLACPALLVGLVMTRDGTVQEARTVTPVPESSLQPSGDGRGRPDRARALRILHGWDRRRAAAWASADGRAIEDLYTRRCAARRRDADMLRQWTERGLVVRSMQTQVRGLTLVSSAQKRIVLAVTDRLVGARAVVTEDPEQVRSLPRDRWSSRRITLRRTPRGWRVAAVQDS